MINRADIKPDDIFICVLSIILVLVLIFVEGNKRLIKDSCYDEKYEAAILMDRCMKAIKDEKLARNIMIDPKYDINNTGMIGVEANGITTTLGSLESKRTSTNPNFAAVMVDLLKKAGIKSGDHIAVNFSSSFPALNISVLSACEILDISATIITSIGSSTWGGNNLKFTYLDMEEFLYREGLISNKSVAVSIGGAFDIGKNMDKDDVDTILNRVMKDKKQIIIEENLKKNIELRYKIYYEDTDTIKCFINVGGNLVSFGNTIDSVYASPGLIYAKKYISSNKTGLVQLFNSKNIPVIHILNVKELASKYGLEIDLSSGFVIGEGDVYYSYEYPYKLILVTIILTIVLLIIHRKRVRIVHEE